VNELLTYAHISVCAIRDIAERIKESAKWELKCLFMKQDWHNPIEMDDTKNYGCESLTFVLY